MNFLEYLNTFFSSLKAKFNKIVNCLKKNSKLMQQLKNRKQRGGFLGVKLLYKKVIMPKSLNLVCKFVRFSGESKNQRKARQELF